MAYYAAKASVTTDSDRSSVTSELLKDEEAHPLLDLSTTSELSSPNIAEVKTLKPSDARKRVEDWITSSNKLRLILIGKVGAGKSTLVNSLLRIEEAEVGSSLTPVTTEVSSYKGSAKEVSLPLLKLTIRDIDVEIWDTPGLEDSDEEQAQASLESIKQTWSKNQISLLIYCIDMTRTRVELGDKKSIKLLTQELGEDVWCHTLFALTRANQVKVPRSAAKDTTRKEEFERRWREWSAIIKDEYLIKENVPRIVVDEIPFVPCGYRDEPLTVLQDSDWSATFWRVCLARMLFESIPAFLVIRGTNSVDGRLSEDCAEVILRRMAAPTHSEADFIQSLLEGSSPDEVTDLISDILTAKVMKRNEKISGFFVLWSCFSLCFIGIAG